MEVLMYSLLLMAIVSNITVVNKVIVITIVLLFLQGEHRQKKKMCVLQKVPTARSLHLTAHFVTGVD